MTGVERNRKPHPTASALFESLEQESTSLKSARLRKIASVAGWRNRQCCSVSVFCQHSNENISFSVSQSPSEKETGTSVWPAAIVLIKYLEKDRLKGRSVVDLGSGTGITSIAASFSGAESVICTDGSVEALDGARLNIEKALAEHPLMDEQRLVSRLYRWGDAEMSKSLLSYLRKSDYFDVILVSDCVLPKLFPIRPLIRAMQQLSGPNTTTYISYEHRHYLEYDPKTKFWDLAMEAGFHVTEVPLDKHHPVYSAEDIEIWEINKKSPM